MTITADSDAPVAKASVDYIKQTWEEALPGLKVEEKFVTFKQRLEDTKNQNFDVALFLWGGDYPEGSHSMDSLHQIQLTTTVSSQMRHTMQHTKKHSLQML